MKLDHKAKYFTLDWDNISIDEARKRTNFILDNYCNVKKLVLSLSPTKGFHVRITLWSNSNILSLRNSFKDDGRRVINDIFNRDDNIHDILWTRKTLNGIRFEEKHLTTYYRKKPYGKG